MRPGITNAIPAVLVAVIISAAGLSVVALQTTTSTSRAETSTVISVSTTIVTVAVTQGCLAAPDTFTLMAAFKVVALDASGRPAPGVVVTLNFTGAKISPFPATDSSGKATLSPGCLVYPVNQPPIGGTRLLARDVSGRPVPRVVVTLYAAGSRVGTFPATDLSGKAISLLGSSSNFDAPC